MLVVALLLSSGAPIVPAFAQESVTEPAPEVVETPTETVESTPAPEQTPESTETVSAPAQTQDQPSESTTSEIAASESQTQTPGQDGEDNTGLDGGETASEPENGTDGEAGAPSEIVTGNASSVSDTGTQANANTVDTPENADTTIDATNDADVTASTTAEAQTGENAASGGSGGASVSTGDAYASGNAINVVNTNIIDSSGMLLFLNLLFGGGYDFSNLDLSYFLSGEQSGTMNGCTFMGCDGAEVHVSADNDATVLNSVIVRAMTGGNSAEGEGGASIDTGNAYATGNAVNLVNSNIINSNYLLVSLNSFGDLAEDIILPGASFFEQLFQQQSAQLGALTVNATNTATVTDSTNATADSGSNTATGDGSASVQTGNAVSSATSYNQVNSTLIGGTQVFMLFRIWGDFSGSITGLPSGMKWRETPMGIELVNEDGTAASTDALADDCCGQGSLTASTTNVANLTNNVNVYALTGDNRADSASSTAEISTGNAYASANSVNVVNTNLIGRNWIFMIFNIFGNFSGNISFGQPNLWLGASAVAGNPTLPGSPVEYHFTVANTGDSDASNVMLTADFLKGMLDFENVEEVDGKAIWNLGSIKRGETREFIYRARTGVIPEGSSVAVPLTATVTSQENDSNATDNTEKIDLVVMSPGTVMHSGPGRAAYTVDPVITMQKVSSVVATSAPAQIDYAVIINNEGGQAYNVQLHDELVGPFGNFIGDQEWDLGTILPGEEVRVEYTVAYGADIAPGFYKNTARLTGQKNNSVDQYATDMAPVETSNIIEIRPRGEVLGATIEKALCEPYLIDNLREHRTNSTKEVKKLQSFLAKSEGETVEQSGRYDSGTVAAVKRFQAKYADEILAPWGLTVPTGNVYHTTKKKINELYCENTRIFDLTQEQLEEITKFRSLSPVEQETTTWKGNVGGEPINRELAQPRRIEKPSVPVVEMLLGFPTSTEDNGTSTIIRHTQSFLQSPVLFLSKFLLSFAPVAEAQMR